MLLLLVLSATGTTAAPRRSPQSKAETQQSPTSDPPCIELGGFTGCSRINGITAKISDTEQLRILDEMSLHAAQYTIDAKYTYENPNRVNCHFQDIIETCIQAIASPQELQQTQTIYPWANIEWEETHGITWTPQNLIGSHICNGTTNQHRICYSECVNNAISCFRDLVGNYYDEGVKTCRNEDAVSYYDEESCIGPTRKHKMVTYTITFPDQAEHIPEEAFQHENIVPELYEKIAEILQWLPLDLRHDMQNKPEHKNIKFTLFSKNLDHVLYTTAQNEIALQEFAPHAHAYFRKYNDTLHSLNPVIQARYEPGTQTSQPFYTTTAGAFVIAAAALVAVTLLAGCTSSYSKHST